MAKPFLLIIAFLLLTTALAGCHEPEGTGPGTPDDGMDGGNGAEATEIMLTVIDAPDTVAANETFEVTVRVEADGAVISAHFGAHYSYNSTAGNDDVTAADFDGASPHVFEETELGATYTITGWSFSADEVGMIYFRAHVETSAGHFWSDEYTIVVTPEA